ncbi:MAG: Clp protease N-terminal domain-containing protein, partial [Candidatus Nealsonbacteria bacterium]
MNGNFTNKAQEAILSAQDTARSLGQQQIDALHLLLALVSQEGSVVLTLLQKIGV